MGIELEPQNLAAILSAPPDLATVVPLAVVFVLALAVIPAVVAHMKGHNLVLWYLYGCVLFPGALVQALLLANRKKRQATSISQATSFSQAEELERWARLRDRGLLTEAEFELKKRQLLQSTPRA